MDNTRNTNNINNIEQFKKDNFPATPINMISTNSEENKIWFQPTQKHSPVIIKFDNPDKIKTISWKTSMDKEGNLIIKKPMDFNTQTDRNFFANLFEAPEDMNKEEFYEYFKKNPIGMICYNDLSEEDKRLVDTMEEIPTNF